MLSIIKCDQLHLTYVGNGMRIHWRQGSVVIICAVALAGVSIFYSYWLERDRLMPDWQWHTRFIGIATYPDPASGQFPANDVSVFYERYMFIVPQAADPTPGVIMLEDHYTIKDTNNQNVLWDYVFKAPVQQNDGKHVTPAFTGNYFVFPTHVKRDITYTLRYSYVKGVPMTFQTEETLEGLKTYRFAYHGRGEYTESYLGTEQYPGEKLNPGQEIRCSHNAFELRFWVEPMTGETIKVEEGCRTGDYVYNIGSDQPIRPVLRWYGTTTGDDVLKRVNAVENKLRLLRWLRWYLPIALLAIAVLIIPLRKQSLTVLQ
jgi:hypothetical protein